MNTFQHNSIMPGKESVPNISAEYEESTCTLYNDRGNPDGGDTLIREDNAWHFNEVCLSCMKNIYNSLFTDTKDSKNL